MILIFDMHVCALHLLSFCLTFAFLSYLVANSSNRTYSDIKPNNSSQIKCSNQFYLSNGTCLPLCDELSFYSNQLSVYYIVSNCSRHIWNRNTHIIIHLEKEDVRLACMLVYLNTSIHLHYASRFVFPSVIVVYVVISGMVLSKFVSVPLKL